MKTTFLYDCPPEIMVPVQGYLTEFAWIMPGWLLRLTIQYDRDARSIHTVLKPDRRKCEFTIGAAWLDQPIEKRREDVLHEIVHICIADWTDLLHRVNETWVPEEFRGFVTREGDMKMEQAIVDLTHAILQHEDD